MAIENSFIEKAYSDYTTFRDTTTDWRRETDKMRKYYFGQQHSERMSEKYAQRGWTDIVVNKIRPLIKQKISRMIASKPAGKVFGYSAVDMPTANALNELLDYTYTTSEGQLQFEEGATYQLREGVGYWIVVRDWTAEYGRGELRFVAESFENIFTRKSSRKWDYSDAGRVIHSKLTDKADIEFRLHKWVKELNLDEFLHVHDIPQFTGKKKDRKFDTIGVPQATQGGNRYIREFDIYDMVHKEIRAVYYIPTNTIIQVADDYTPNDEENRMIKDGIIKFDEFTVPRVQYTKFIGNATNSKQIGEQETLPIDFCPIVPIQNERTGNVQSLSETSFFYGNQEMLNQSIALMVMHAALASLFKVIVDTRKGVDIENFKTEWAALGAVVGLEQDPETGKFPIEIIRPEQINPAFWPMVQYFGSEMEYEAQSSPVHWGVSTKTSPETLPPLLALNEWADNSLRMHLSHFELAVERLYTILLQWSKSFYDYKTFPIVRNKQEVENFINSKIPLDTGFRNPSTGKAILSTNNIRQLKTRFRIRLGSTLPPPTSKYEQIFKEMSMKYPVFLKYMVKYMDIEESEKNELIEAVDIVKQQQMTISQLSNSVQAISKQLKTEIARNIDLEKAHDVDQIKHRADKALVQQKAKAEVELEKMKNK